MLKNRNISKISVILISFGLSLIYFDISNSAKADFTLSKKISYKITNLDNNYLKIKILSEKQKKENGIKSIFFKDTIYSKSLFIKTKECKKNNFFLISRYNDNSYSDIYKLKPIINDIYISIYNSNNHLNFSHFEIHKKDIECIGNIFEVKKNKEPITYKIFINKNISYNYKNLKNINFSDNYFNILTYDKKLKISENEISLNKNFGYNQTDYIDQKSDYNKIYLRKIKKPFLIKDILSAKIDGEYIKSLVINCKIISGTINFLIFDKSNKNLIEKETCKDKEGLYLNIPRQKNLNLIISSQTFRMNSDEVSFKLNFEFIPT